MTGSGSFLAAALIAAFASCGTRDGRARTDTPSSDTTRSAAATRPDSATPSDSTTRPDSNRPTATGAAVSVTQADSVNALLETGCGGGFSGGGGGTFLTADGKFYHFRFQTPNAKRELTLVRTDTARAAELVRRAKKEGIERITYVHPSNMTCYLTLTGGSSTHEVSWPMGTKPDSIARLLAVAKALDEAASR